jgi:hypothetical protein
MTGHDALELLFLTGQALALLSLPYFFYLVIRFRAWPLILASGAPSGSRPRLQRDGLPAADEPARDHDDHPQGIAHA